MKVNKSSAVTAQPFESVNDLIIDAIRDIKGKNITKIVYFTIYTFVDRKMLLLFLMNADSIQCNGLKVEYCK